MKTIAYYITDSGFGHLTRSVAIIKYILENSDYNVLIACDTPQNEHAKIDLRQYEDRLIFIDVYTDANSVFFENSLKVNVEATEDNINAYNRMLSRTVKNQYNLLKAMNIAMVITDISILGIMLAKKLGVKVIGISNYTWYNRFKAMGISEDVITVYKDWYNQLDLLYRFELSDSMDGIDCPMEDVGLVCREVNEMGANDLKRFYWPAVYISVGQVEKKKEKFNINFPSGTVFATGNLDVEGSVHVVKLPHRVAHTQDYIAASSFALIKGGWSSVAECLILNIPFGILIQDATEDAELVGKLLRRTTLSRQPKRNFEISRSGDEHQVTSCARPVYENDAQNIANKLIAHADNGGPIE